MNDENQKFLVKMPKPAEIVLRKCLDLKKDEKLLVVTDSKLYGIAKMFFDEGRRITKDGKLIRIPIPKVHGTEPSKKTAKEMLKYDVELLITTKSLSHTKARKNACDKGARIVTMPGITRDIVERSLIADYEKIREKNKNLIKKLKEGKVIRAKTKNGTDISLEIFNKKWFNDSGIYSRKRDFGNLPAGEIGFMPTEGKSEGVFVVDGSIGNLGLVDKPVKIFVKDGFATMISVGKTAKKLKKMLTTKKHRNIAEFAIGTNPKAKITGVTLEDEKAEGTVHIALGNNKSYGGNFNVPFHVDCIIKKPDVFIDGKRIMDRGKLII